jgi:hypothetical protein
MLMLLARLVTPEALLAGYRRFFVKSTSRLLSELRILLID